MLSRLRGKFKEGQPITTYDALKIKQGGPANSIFLPSRKNTFSGNDTTKLSREAEIQSNLKALTEYQLSTNTESTHLLCPVKEWYGIPHTFKAGASKDSRRSTMALAARLGDGHIYPTSCAVDPYFRAPMLKIEEEEVDNEEIEMPRGLSRPQRKQFYLQPGMRCPGKINQTSREVALSTWYAEKEGRNVVSLLEYGILQGRYDTLEAYLIPLTDINDEFLDTIVHDVLLNTTGPYTLPTGMTRENKLTVLEKLLQVLGFAADEWKTAIRYVGRIKGTSSELAGKANELSNRFQTTSGNIYKSPVFISRSVTDVLWEKKPQQYVSARMESVPQRKRSIGECTFYESDAKQVKNVTLQDISNGIDKMAQLAAEVSAVRGLSRQAVALEEHTELAENLIEKVKAITVLNDNERKELMEEKQHVANMLEHSRSLIKSLENEAEDSMEELRRVEALKKDLEGRLKDAQSSGQANILEEKDPGLKPEEYDDRLKELEQQLDTKNSTIHKLKTENEDWMKRYSDLNDKMDESLRLKDEIDQMDISLTASVKKQQQKMKNMVSPISSIVNPCFVSDSDEDEEFQSCEKTIQKPLQHKSNFSLAALTLTPQKIGLKAWDDNLQNFVEWFSSMRMQIEAAIKSAAAEEASIIRLILMCLPAKYQWVAHTIVDKTEITTVEQAKNEIIKMIYPQGLLKDFFNANMTTTENPMSFLNRLQDNLVNQDLNSPFLLQALEEKLINNLSNTQTVELQRLLQSQRQNLTFEKLKDCLRKAVILTTNQKNQNNINFMGEEILAAVNALHRNMKKCFICNSTDHIASSCPKRRNFQKNSNGKNRFGSRRETKTKKSGNRCHFCNIPGHFKRDCRKYKATLQKSKNQ